MSTLALMTAVRDTLIAEPTLGLKAESCDITDRGQPTPSAGDLFVGVWYGYWRDLASNGECLHDEHGVNVTISMRSTRFPEDRLGREMLAKIKVGLIAYARRVAVLIHMDPQNVTENGVAYSSIMKRANDIIGRNHNGFITPPQFKDGGQPERKPGSWWTAQAKENRAGMAQTVSFGGAQCIQQISSMG